MQQETNRAAVASAGALKQMSELLRGSCLVCSPRAGPDQGGPWRRGGGAWSLWPGEAGALEGYGGH